MESVIRWLIVEDSYQLFLQLFFLKPWLVLENSLYPKEKSEYSVSDFKAVFSNLVL